MSVPSTTPPFRILWLFPACCLGSQLLAAQPPSAEDPSLIEEVTVTATLLPRSTEEIAGTVTLIDTADIQRQVANDLNDLTRYLPGLGMDTAARGGNQGFSIRGIGGNRVLMVLDGVRSADIYAAGPSSYGKDMFEVDDLKAVEIIRGPASVLHGADAMGGAVLLRSKDPLDYLADERNFHVGLRSSAASDNDQYKAGVTLAGQHGKLGSMLQFTRREFGEREVEGAGRLNPQAGDSAGFFWKSVWQPAQKRRLTLTLDYNDEVVDTRLDNELGSSVFSSTGSDTSTRKRLGLSHEWTLNAPLADSFTLQLNHQDTTARQYSEQLRTSYAFVDPRLPATARGSEALRWSDFRFNQQNRSARLVADKSFGMAGSEHAAVYGLSYERTDTERPRARCDRETATGFTSCAIPSYPFAAPEIFPNKTFPDTRTTRVGVFLQDEITLPGGRLVLIPGVRYNSYRMDPHPDALLNGSGNIADYGGFSVSAVTEHDTSLNAGLLYDLTEQLSLFAQYAEGFRPPNFDESNQAFVNLAHGYATIPNPALRAESSRGLEAGIRGSFAQLAFSVVAYHNRYRDFIDSLAVGTVNGISLFQDTNIGAARIYGSEASLTWLLNPHWSWRAALAWSRGEDEQSGSPLNSVEPLTAVTGLRYQTADGRWELDGVLTLAAAQNRVSAPDRAHGAAWQVVDLMGRYNLTRQASLRFGIFNLLDQAYAPWSNVKGLAASASQNLANAHMPGANVRVGLDYQF
jgi:hemoglobin/transferrin/lactoferrin receptor protein